MIRERFKRAGCSPAVADPYTCEDRLRNQFVQYHDRTAWYTTVYSEFIQGGRAELPASTTLLGVKEVVTAYYVERLKQAAQQSPEAFAQAYALAVASGPVAEAAAHAALAEYVESGMAVASAAILAVWDEAFPPDGEADDDSSDTWAIEQETADENAAGAIYAGAPGERGADGVAPTLWQVEASLEGQIQGLLPPGLYLVEQGGSSALLGEGQREYIDPATGQSYLLVWSTGPGGDRNYQLQGPPAASGPIQASGTMGPRGGSDIYEGLDRATSTDIYEGLDSPAPSPPHPQLATPGTVPRPPDTTSPPWQGEAQDVLRAARPPDGPPAAFEPPAPLFGPPAPPSAPRDPAAKRTRRAVPWQEPERDPFRQALVDFGEYAQGATEALGKDVGKAYGALWDLGFRALQQVGVAGDRESARPWRDAAVGVVERSTEILSGAIADAATFGVTSFGPLTQRAEEIVDERTRNQDDVGLDEAGLIALDVFNVFNPVDHLRIAAQKALEARDAGDSEEVGKRYTDAVVAAAQIFAFGKGAIDEARRPGSPSRGPEGYRSRKRFYNAARQFFRRKLKAVRPPPRSEMVVHHELPLEHYEKFLEHGFDPQDARKYGQWMDAPKHRQLHKDYNQRWSQLFKTEATPEDVRLLLEDLRAKYGHLYH